MLREFSGLGPENRCPCALAPMQDVTGLGLSLTARRGPPDFFTEFSGLCSFEIRRGDSRVNHPESNRSAGFCPTYWGELG